MIPIDIQCEGESGSFLHISSSVDTAAWKRWSEFHYQLDFCPGVQPCLRFTSATPSPEVISLWKGEPVDMILIPTSLFTWEEDGAVAHLPSHYESLLTWFKYNKMVRIIIEGALDSEAQQLTIIHNVRFSFSLPF